MLDDMEGLIVCNGYKDREFIELALMGLKMGKRVFIVACTCAWRVSTTNWSRWWKGNRWQILDYVHFHHGVLVDRIRRQLLEARDAGRITVREATRFLRFYQEGLKGYTYLEEKAPTIPSNHARL